VKRRRWKLEDLACLGAVERASRVKDGAPRVKGMSKTERAYKHHLDVLVEAGEVQSYEAQPAAIELAHRCRYTADFRVVYTDESRPIEMVEVKGAKGKRPWFRDDGARVKVRVAARIIHQSWPDVVLVVVWPLAKKYGGGWAREVVKP
jgi:hypothetical protein